MKCPTCQQEIKRIALNGRQKKALQSFKLNYPNGFFVKVSESGLISSNRQWPRSMTAKTFQALIKKGWIDKLVIDNPAPNYDEFLYTAKGKNDD